MHDCLESQHYMAYCIPRFSNHI